MTSLNLSTQADPWLISFGVLRQSAPAGFWCEPRWHGQAVREDICDPAAPDWHRVTRVRSHQVTDDGLIAVLDTDHPDGLTAKARIRVSGRDSVAVTFSVPGAAIISQSFAAEPGERFLGFGERSHAVSLDRGVLENYVGEGPYQPHEYQFLAGTVPPWAIRERLDATYFPVPWLVSTRGYGLSIDQDDVSYLRLRTDAEDSWSIEAEADQLAFTVYAGPGPLDALRRYTDVHGRQPAPARWFFGPWYQTGHDNHVPLAEEERQLAALGDAAVSAAETHCRYLPLGEDRGYEDAERARTEFFHSRGLAVVSYINPIVARDYPDAFKPAEEAGALQRDASGEPYLYQAYAGGRVPPHTDETQYDFSHPAAARCWGAVAERIAQAGYDGWMEDFGEYTPLDAVTAAGRTGPGPHNRYPTEFHEVGATVAADLEDRYDRHLVRFVRSGWIGTAPAVPIVWGGDPTTSWGYDGLASAVTCGLSMGASGIAMWGSDTGGFMSTLDQLTPELLRRWIQFSAFCPVMRTKASGIEVPEYRRPQIWDPDVLPTWRRYARWHTRLNDYLMAAHETYRATGRPIMCALELVYPGIGPVPDQYLLGADLLVAPVLEPNRTTRRVVFPAGRWADLFDPRRSFTGPAELDAPAGTDDIPVFVRAGAVLALLPDEVGSLSPYAPAVPDRRVLLAVPGDAGQAWSGSLGPGLSGQAATAADGWTLGLHADRTMSWQLTLPLPAAPAGVSGADGWSYADGMLSAELAGSSVALHVRYGSQPG